jgi:hypothetical protein
MSDMAGVVAALASSLFAGAAACGTEIAMAQWAPSYKRATIMQVPLAVVAALGYSSPGVTGVRRRHAGSWKGGDDCMP